MCLKQCGVPTPVTCPGGPLSQLTQAERELSPRTVPALARPAPPAPPGRRRSYGDFDGINLLSMTSKPIKSI